MLKSAEQGNAEAQYNLGLMYYNGEDVEKDFPTAKYWFEKSAEQGNAEAQYKLGDIYYNGQGGKRDHTQEFHW